MSQDPIRKVLSSIQANSVKALLMGGQACVLFGGAEFSRNIDLAILADPDNLENLQKALDELQADCIAVPPFELKYLTKGHAVHFRCKHPEANGMRIDVMSEMRGLDKFSTLWSRRATVADEDGFAFELLSLPDLIKAKKTQRDKDWPMIRRLVEAHYFEHQSEANDERVLFWLRELRTPQLLSAVAASRTNIARRTITERPLVRLALENKLEALREALAEEERLERELDRTYWEPLKKELEQLRHQKG